MNPRAEFPTTHWSLVIHAGGRGDSHSQAQDALEALCRKYWYPLYAFVRRLGRSHHEAEDCTQEFLARLLADNRIASARPERGRFRTFLLSAFRNFLINEWRRSLTIKRGAGIAIVPLDGGDADLRFAREPVADALTPEQAFDRTWAKDLIEKTLNELQRDYERRGQGAVFRVLAPLAWTNAEAEGAAPLANSVGLTPQALTVALHRLRRRLGERLRAHVAETVANSSEIDAELRHLIAAVSEQR